MTLAQQTLHVMEKERDFSRATIERLGKLSRTSSESKPLAEEDICTIAEDEGGGKWSEEPAV